MWVRAPRPLTGSAARTRTAAAPRSAGRDSAALLGRVLLDQLPRHRPIQHLPQRLRRLEAMPLRNLEAPRTHLLCRELDKTRSTQLRGRLPEQPAQLRDGDAFTLMRRQVLLDPLPERDRRRTAAGHEPGQLVLKRPLRLRPTAEPAHLQSCRPATGDPIPVCPQRLPIRGARLQLEHLTLLIHFESPRSTTRPRNHTG